MKMNLLLITVLLCLSACATSSRTDFSKNTFTPEKFSGNPRIVLRDITVPFESAWKRVAIDKHDRAVKPTISIKEMYGSSINDSFNGVSHSYMPHLPVSTVSQEQKEIAVVSSIEHPSSPKHNLTQTTIPQGTTYVPLTFPVPPPKAMMQQFHMQVGQSGNSHQLDS